MTKRIISLLLVLITLLTLAVPVYAADKLATPKITSITGGAGEVTVTWDRVNGAAQYRLFYQKNGKWKALSDTTGTSMVCPNAKAGTTYIFTVRCVSADGSKYTSDYDAKGYTYTVPGSSKLATPKITNVTGGAGNVKVTWGAVSGAAKYRLFYLSGGKWKSLGDTTATSMVCPKAKANTTYTFTVRCINANATAYTSGYDAKGYTYTVPGSSKLATPKITNITGGAGNVKVTWGAVSGAAKYRLFYLSGGKWKSLGDTTSTSMVCPKAKANTTYVFTVRCVNADGSKYTSDYDAKGYTYTVPGSSKLATPKITNVTGGAGEVKVTWGKVSGAAKYRLFYKSGNSWKSLGDTTATSMVCPKAKANTTYVFTVRCLSADGSKYTSDYDAKGYTYTVPGAGKLATPQITKLSNGAYRIYMEWGPVAGAKMYRVFYKLDGQKGWITLGDTPYAYYDTSSSQPYLSLENGVNYTFTVRCLSADGKSYTSDYDPTGKSIVYFSPPPVFQIESVSGGVKIYWGSTEGIAQYRVFYKTVSGKWTKIKDIPSAGSAPTMNYIWAGAKSGTTYAFTVRGLDSKGNYITDYENPEPNFVYTPSQTPAETVDNSLAAPKFMSAFNTGSNITVNYEAPFEANSGYGIQAYFASDTDFTVNFTESSSEYLNRGIYASLNYGYVDQYTAQPYYFKARVYKTEGNKTVYGPWSAVNRVEGVNFQTRLNRAAKYSYDVYFVDNIGTDVYTGTEKAIYIKTANPNPGTIRLAANGTDILGKYIIWGSYDYYDDAGYLRIDDSDMLLRQVPGGYLGIVNIEKPGKLTVELQEAGSDGYVAVKSFSLNVLDYDKAEDAWYNSVIAAATTSSMNPKEKMDAVVEYVLGMNFKYVTCYASGMNELLLNMAAIPNTPFFLAKRWDSAVSPYALEQIANRIGGFEEVHDCFNDYPRGTEEWLQWHYVTYVVYEGETYYYQVCPYTATGYVDPSQIDYSNTSALTKIG